MFRLLVVDDEPVIADGLYEVLKEVDGFEVEVYKAYSGFEALALLNTKKMDLIVTDIRMQGMNGLELVDKIRSNWPECKIVFLTGHDEFDYAYRALQFNGVSYLLKNEDYEKVVETVRMHLTNLVKSLQDERLLRMAKDQMEMALPLLRRELLIDILEQGDGGHLRDRFAELNIDLSVDQPVMLIIGCREGGSAKWSTMSGRAEAEYTVSRIVERFLSPYASSVETVYRQTYFIWFAQPIPHSDRADEGQMTSVFLKGALELAQQACQQSLGFSLSFIISSESVDWDALADKFSYMRSVLNHRLRQGTGILITTDDFYRSEAGHYLYSDGHAQLVQKKLKNLDLLEVFIEQGQADLFFESYDQLQTALTEREIEDQTIRYEIKQRVTLFFISFLNRYRLIGQMRNEVDLEQLLIGCPDLTLTETLERCRQLAESLFKIRHAEQERRSMKMILQIQQYIQDNLHGDLSLTTLADKVYFNAKYFSRLFRHVTGAYLSDYIHEHRLQKAKDLLAQPQFKIHEVGASIGYRSASYFTRFFKRAMQMSPQEYRDLRYSAQSAEQRGEDEVDKG